MTQTIHSNEQVSTTIQFEDSTMVPDRAFSLGVGSGIAAYHFLATSEAEFRRDPGNRRIAIQVRPTHKLFTSSARILSAL